MIILTDAEPRETRNSLQMPAWLLRETAALRLSEAQMLQRVFPPVILDAYGRPHMEMLKQGDTISVRLPRRYKDQRVTP